MFTDKLAPRLTDKVRHYAAAQPDEFALLKMEAETLGKQWGKVAISDAAMHVTSDMHPVSYEPLLPSDYPLFF